MPKSLKQVLDQIAKLEKEAQALRSQEVAGVVARIKEAIAHYGLSPQDLFGKQAAAAATRKPRRAAAGGAKRPVAPPKFRDAAGNTWSGIGKRPNWFKAALAAGRTADELLIRD